VKRPDEERPGPGSPEEERRRLFEESRGLSEKRELDLDEDSTGEEPETVEAPKEEPASDESEETRETG
jgi:hypothetical protein